MAILTARLRFSFRVLRLDLNADSNGLADSGDRLGGWSKHQVEITPRDRIDCYSPTRPLRVVKRGN